MQKIILSLIAVFLITSCASNKELEALKTKQAATESELVTVKNNLIKCLAQKESAQEKTRLLEGTISDLKKDKQTQLEQVGNLTVLTKGANDNIKQAMAQLGKKDEYINRIRAAASKKDSLNLVVAFHLKKELQEGINDKDIEINVEKTVVFISISDKLLFKSGSYTITPKASKVLAKVATVVNGQPQMDVMVEGHTDNSPVAVGSSMKDNWGLSVLRSTAVVRELQDKYSVEPSRLIAAGRSSYVPLVDNSTPSNKAKNRRTKIIVMPKLNQFFNLLDQKVE